VVTVFLMELVVYDTPGDAAVGAAQRIADLRDATGGRFTLGLAGGSTPAATYEELRVLAVDWTGVDVWLSDERWVPHDHERSNGRMAAETLIDHVDARYHRPRWSEHLNAHDSAAHYEATLRSIHEGHRPDLILLGVGEDAHTASLFPGSEALSEERRWFVANTIPETGEERLTATYPLLWSARRLMVLTTGEKKAPALRDSFEGEPTPVGRIAEGEAEVEWHVDRSAVSLLS
jgi:6-phosphogluconolactonase